MAMTSQPYEEVGVVKITDLLKPPPILKSTPAPVQKAQDVNAGQKMQGKKPPLLMSTKAAPLMDSSNERQGNSGNKMLRTADRRMLEQVGMDKDKGVNSANRDASEATPTETVVRSMTYSADDPAPLVLTTIAKILLIVCAFVFLLGLSLIAVSAVGIVQGW